MLPAFLVRHKNGTLFLVCTWSIRSAENPEGPWSEPIELKPPHNNARHWEDPFLFIDDRGFHILSHIYSSKPSNICFSSHGIRISLWLSALGNFPSPDQAGLLGDSGGLSEQHDLRVRVFSGRNHLDVFQRGAVRECCSTYGRYIRSLRDDGAPEIVLWRQSGSNAADAHSEWRVRSRVGQ